MDEKIQSLREIVGREYEKPDPAKLDKFVEALKATEKAQEFLSARGLSEETIKHFKLGYSKYYNAIAIPIFKKGELVNFKYRFLNPKKIKYVSEKNAENWIYNEEGLDEAEKKKAILIVEGEFDLMMCHQKGIVNVVSPVFGKDSFSAWIARMDEIPKVYIAYDNDVGGKASAIKIAQRVGLDKSYEVLYPEGVKDASEFFEDKEKDDFMKLVDDSKAFYSYQFKGLGDIIVGLRSQEDDLIRLKLIPKVEIEKDWLMIVSGKSNVGKTSYVLNLADELSSSGTPTLVMPFERGISSVGKRFLQVKFDRTVHEFTSLDDKGWEKVIDDCIDTPIYFSLPAKDDIVDTIIQARRFFDTRVVIIDHLDYIVRNNSYNKEAEIGNTLQNLKRVAEENGIIIIIVTHVRKIESAGSEGNRKPNMEDLKGSSSLYQDPECVIMLSTAGPEQLDVDVVKNKGEMASNMYLINNATGKINPEGLNLE